MIPATFGLSSATPFAFYDPDSSCWRTSQGTFPLDSTPSSVILPKQGSMRNGRLYAHPTSAPATSEPDSSSLLPTPDCAFGGKKIPEDAVWSGKAAYKPDGTKVQVGIGRIAMLLPTPAAQEPGGAHGDGGLDLRTVVADTLREGLEGTVREGVQGDRPGLAWGDYEAAIRRHEHTLGRPAPAPTDQRERLAVPFVEWMQMLPEGWVDGLTRTQALKCLGNCVVPAQAVAALKALA